ncbi:MAG: 30S ribosomal protein S6 [Planctomycetota bacterium]
MQQSDVHAYEGLFLFPHTATADLHDAVEHLKDIVTRVDAKIISLRKWDERRLAYEIKGNKRGLYFLMYFRARADQMTTIERACNLSEQVLRSLIVRADHLTPEQIEAADGQAELSDEINLRAAEAEAATKPAEPSGEEEPEQITPEP